MLPALLYMTYILVHKVLISYINYEGNNSQRKRLNAAISRGLKTRLGKPKWLLKPVTSV
jgi:hypothetical protein